jgi:uncharacterized membrane protein
MDPLFQAAAKTTAADAANWPRLFHVLGVVTYVGGLLAVSRMLALLPSTAAEQRTAAAALARRVYLTVPIPGLVVLLLAGLHSVFADPLKKDYFHQPWFLMKLTLVLVLMTVDHLLVLRPLKSLARGEGDPAANTALYRAAFWVVGLLAFALLMTLYVFRYL